MLKIRGISNAENLLTGVNRFGHCLTVIRLIRISCAIPDFDPHKTPPDFGARLPPSPLIPVTFCHFSTSSGHVMRINIRPRLLKARPSDCERVQAFTYLYYTRSVVMRLMPRDGVIKRASRFLGMSGMRRNESGSADRLTHLRSSELIGLYFSSCCASSSRW